MTLLRPEDVATHLGISRSEVIDRCRTKEWPHTRVGKFYRFTALQLEGIEAKCAVEPTAPAPEKAAADSWGLVTRGGKR